MPEVFVSKDKEKVDQAVDSGICTQNAVYQAILPETFKENFPERSITPPPVLHLSDFQTVEALKKLNGLGLWRACSDTFGKRLEKLDEVLTELVVLSSICGKDLLNKVLQIVSELKTNMVNIKSIKADIDDFITKASSEDNYEDTQAADSKQYSSINRKLIAGINKLMYNEPSEFMALYYNKEEYCYAKDVHVLHYKLPVLQEQERNILGITNDHETMAIAVQRETDKTSSRQSRGTQPEFVVTKLLHPLELALLSEAICVLFSKKFQSTSLVVDIFDREKEGAIKTDDSHVITHTILLRKEIIGTKKQLIVVDPNNSNFSKHIADPIYQGLISSIIGEWIDIFIPVKQLSIYLSKGTPGPNDSDFRDCEDISIKLCKLFNTEDKDDRITVLSVENTLQEHEIKKNIVQLSKTKAVQYITNSSKVNDNLSAIDASYSIRTRQSTNSEYSKQLVERYAFLGRQEEFIKNYIGQSQGAAASSTRVEKITELLDENNINENTFHELITKLDELCKISGDIISLHLVKDKVLPQEVKPSGEESIDTH